MKLLDHNFTPRLAASTRSRAFTMLEVLIAMGIFAVGFVAVAAIFPTAVLLQKKTVDDVVAQQVARNAQALLEARGMRLGTGADGHLHHQLTSTPTGVNWDTDQRVHPVPAPMITDAVPLLPTPPEKWLLPDRSYPSGVNPVESRKAFWVPFVRDPDRTSGVITNNLIVYVFVLQRATDGRYPRPGLNPDEWANFYDGWVDNGSTPGVVDANDTFNIPAVTKAAVTVDIADLQRFDFGPGNNQFTTAAGIFFRVNPGDKILDCYGSIYSVRSADPNGINIVESINPNLDTGNYPSEIWYALPDENGRLRPTTRILTLTKAVK